MVIFDDRMLKIFKFKHCNWQRRTKFPVLFGKFSFTKWNKNCNISLYWSNWLAAGFETEQAKHFCVESETNLFKRCLIKCFEVIFKRTEKNFEK